MLKLLKRLVSFSARLLVLVGLLWPTWLWLGAHLFRHRFVEAGPKLLVLGLGLGYLQVRQLASAWRERQLARPWKKTLTLRQALEVVLDFLCDLFLAAVIIGNWLVGALGFLILVTVCTCPTWALLMSHGFKDTGWLLPAAPYQWDVLVVYAIFQFFLGWMFIGIIQESRRS
jgi:hypothetical protein